MTGPGVDGELVQAGLTEALGEDAQIQLAEMTELLQEGALHVNQFTGRSETFNRGYWLPVFDFASSQGSCNAESAAAL